MANNLPSFTSFLQELAPGRVDNELVSLITQYEQVLGKPPAIPMIAGFFGREGRMTHEEAEQLQDELLETAKMEWRAEIAAALADKLISYT